MVSVPEVLVAVGRRHGRSLLMADIKARYSLVLARSVLNRISLPTGRYVGRLPPASRPMVLSRALAHSVTKKCPPFL